jgi:hypothetical protein
VVLKSIFFWDMIWDMEDCHSLLGAMQETPGFVTCDNLLKKVWRFGRCEASSDPY